MEQCLRETDSCAGNEDCVDITKLDDVSIQSDRETVVLSVPDEFLGAKVDELRSWVKNEVYTEFQDVGRRISLVGGY